MPLNQEGVPELPEDVQQQLVKAARAAVARVVGSKAEEVPDVGMATDGCGVFVTLREPDGTLRGCVGSLIPLSPALTDEVERTAQASATRDPRFPPLEPRELEVYVQRARVPAVLDSLLRVLALEAAA
jgi:AMMECR1 domain-containing protein